jgi:Phospholipid methyltransferase
MESWRRGRRFLAVLSIHSNGSMCQRVTAPLRYAAKASGIPSKVLPGPQLRSVISFMGENKKQAESPATFGSPSTKSAPLKDLKRKASGGLLFASATIELAPEQKVISTGLYKLVRHPMYMGAFFLLVGIPLSLGSLWGLLAIALMMPALVWRLLNEERFLMKNLPGYSEYQNTVKHRLVPLIW